MKIDAEKVDIPQQEGRDWDEFCERYDIYPLGSSRRGWIGSAETYVRGATKAIVVQGRILDVE